MTLKQLRDIAEKVSDTCDELEDIAFCCCDKRPQVDADKQLKLLRKSLGDLRCGLEEMECRIPY